jgi:hypothetical protein
LPLTQRLQHADHHVLADVASHVAVMRPQAGKYPHQIREMTNEFLLGRSITVPNPFGESAEI